MSPPKIRRSWASPERCALGDALRPSREPLVGSLFPRELWENPAGAWGKPAGGVGSDGGCTVWGAYNRAVTDYRLQVEAFPARTAVKEWLWVTCGSARSTTA